MTAEEVAQRMLDMYQTEGDWCGQGLIAYKNGKDVYCLLAARAVIQDGNLGAWNTDSILKDFAGDEYLLKLAAVIREQYQELRERLTPGKWDQLDVIYMFNDTVKFEDVRAVIEKAAAG